MRFLVLVAVAGLTVSSAAWADPPRSVEVSMDSARKVLSVKAIHPTRNTGRHYINLVTVRINDREAVRQMFSSQGDAAFQEGMYVLPDAKPGDTVSVEAACSMGGKRVGTIAVK